MNFRKTARGLAVIVCGLATLAAQEPQETPASVLTSKSSKAIGYQVGGGSTRVDLKSTDLTPGSLGVAKVEARPGVSNIEVEIKGLPQASKFGTEFLTYVLWSVSPEGRTNNLGEVVIDKNGQGKLRATTQLQTFSLIVTAEPYFSVRLPSELVALENDTRKDTKGKIFPINDYKLMRRGHYEKMGNPLALTLDVKNVPLEMYEARNAFEIAKSRGAEKYASEIFTKAEGSLKIAENSLARKADKREVISNAKQTVQFSEDARALAVLRQYEEQVVREREAAAAKAKAEAEAKAAAEAAEAKRRADEEARRQTELAAAREAQLKAEAEAEAARAKATADLAAAKAKSEADALLAREETAKEAARLDAERSRKAAEDSRKAAEDLRARLLDQFNRILETRDTPRGLVVNMADVLFDTGKYDLRSEAREKLARLSGIVLAHPGLMLEVEGHTDSTGSDELNQKLSEQRAGTVRTYLITQGLSEAGVTAQGFGKSMPVADNNTPAGRKQNRRVEIVVSGEVIGAKIGK